MQDKKLVADNWNAMTLNDSGSDFTAEGTAGVGAFKNGSSYYVHAGAYNASPAYKIIGYYGPSSDAASGWTVTDATSVTLTLNEVGGKTYGTTYLPFDVTLPTGEAAGNDVCAYTLTDNGNGWLTLNLLGTDGKSIPAGTPVLLRGTSTTSLTATIADVDAIDAGSNALSGTYVNMDHGDNLVLGKIDNVIGFYKYNFDIKANKAYIDAVADVKGFKLMLDDDATGINTINGSELMVNGPIYNLAGQRLNKMQKGINIVNGKKVLK